MKSLTSTRDKRSSHVPIQAAILILCAIGAALLLSGVVPFATVKAFVDRRASDGHADGFTEPIFRAMIDRTQPTGLILLAYAALLWYLRHRAARWIAGLGRTSRRVGRVFIAVLASWWRTAPVWERWGLLLVLAAGLAVRLLYMQAPLRHDEAFTVEAYARTPFYRMISDWREPNNHILHSLLVGLSIRLFGDAEWAVRLPALTAGWLAISAAFVFFRRLSGGAAALLAAALLAAESAQIEYAALARGYSIVTLLFLLGLLVVADWPARPASPVRRWAFTLIIAIAFCTVLSSIYMAAVLGVWYLLRCAETPGVRWWPALRAMTIAVLAAAALTVFFYLPAGVVHGPSLYLNNKFVQPSAYYYVIPKTAELARHLALYWGEGWPAALYWPLAVLSLAGIALSSRLVSATGTWLPLPLLAVAVCLTLTLLQRVIHFPRSFLFLSPLFLGSAAAALVWLLTRMRLPAVLPWATAAIFLAACGGVIASHSVPNSNEIGNARDIREAAAFLRTQNLDPRDHVSVTLVSSMPAVYYFRKAGIPVSVLDPRRTPPRRLFALEDTIPRTAPEDNAENEVMSNMKLVLRIDGFDTSLMPPPRLLWQSAWSRIWIYEPAE